MTDEEITAVLTSVVALRNKLTLKDFHNICRISVIRERLQRKSLSPKNTTAIFSTIVLLKNKLSHSLRSRAPFTTLRLFRTLRRYAILPGSILSSHAKN